MDRWTRLLRDLEAAAQGAEHRERLAELPEVLRSDQGRVSLSSRLRAHQGAEVRLGIVVGGHRFEGRIEMVAESWLGMEIEVPMSSVIIPVTAIEEVHGLSRRVLEAESPVMARLGLGHALRAVAARSAEVRVHVAAGERRGRIVHVGADHLELLAGERLVIPFGAVRAVQSAVQA